MKRDIKRTIFAALISALLMTGCMKIDMAVELKRDGTASMAITYAMDSEYASEDEFEGHEVQHFNFDGKDYVPTPPTLVFGHHFASIASGLGMIGGALCASSFGWLPVLLWLLVGGIFFGAAQDFGALFVSLRTKGRSIGYMLRERVGERAQRLFSVLALIVLVLLVAVFVSLLAAVFGETNNVSLVGLGLGKEKLTPIV
ncbi:MAG: hypothetical protein IKR73_00665, partial [Oscillospiraceae bacterium]|nr:hypothetical protein [Oscillospiraceae bacterium]